MDIFEARNNVLTRIRLIDPENAPRIMCYILATLQNSDQIRVASSPDNVLHTVVVWARKHLGLSSSSSAPSSPSPLSHASRPSAASNSSSRFNGDSSYSSSHGNPFSLFAVEPISLKSDPLISRNNIHAGSVSKSYLSPSVTVKGDTSAGGNFVDEKQIGEYLSLLNASRNDEELVDPRLEMDQRQHSVVNNTNSQSHRGYDNEIYFEPKEAGMGIGYQPCLDFANGFCKNGSNCKFVHTALNDAGNAASGTFVGSPSNFEGLEQQEEMISLRDMQNQILMADQQLMAAQQFMAAQHFMAGASPSSHAEYIHYMMMQQQQQQYDLQRVAAGAPVMIGGQLYMVGMGGGSERNDFGTMFPDEWPNITSRQIYITFPADSTFQEEDVNGYFRYNMLGCGLRQFTLHNDHWFNCTKEDSVGTH